MGLPCFYTFLSLTVTSHGYCTSSYVSWSLLASDLKQLQLGMTRRPVQVPPTPLFSDRCFLQSQTYVMYPPIVSTGRSTFESVFLVNILPRQFRSTLRKIVIWFVQPRFSFYCILQLISVKIFLPIEVTSGCHLLLVTSTKRTIIDMQSISSFPDGMSTVITTRSCYWLD